MRPRGQVAALAARYPVTAVILHRGETAHVEAGTERPTRAGQYYRSYPFLAGQPLGGGNQRLEHRGIECVHLVRPHQADVGDTVRNRYRDPIFHENSSTLFLWCRFTERRCPDLVNRPINRQSPWVEIMFNDHLLAGRRILVTGGGTGLGKSMA